MLSCKEITHLISESQDRPLGFRQRLDLKLHLLMCHGCANYREHIDFLHQACRNHPARPDREKVP